MNNIIIIIIKLFKFKYLHNLNILFLIFNKLERIKNS